ncbi:hypothetical protein LRP49_19235 [Enterovibrio sp. ZSDZ35]|uniref:Uncharacterized protein n=1 Tax=Enterovibrio qingdaonensis TaxID=2899818 RepID=A0ABT5QQP7_9GAMM|nr:hypothetical protein [Enterovibrio sp. ZSDZ35]MDD1783307.1 hypothetical protein [Enterovibrio sp. ZSDZ35]
MKKLISLVAAVGFASIISFSAHADGNNSGGATQAGPLVMCDYANGTKDYVPSMICKFNGGTFDPNVGQQW